VLIRDAEIAGQRCDVRIRAGRIAAIGSRLDAEAGEPTLEARGGALIPGLHDHHLHLLSLAAALASVDCGPAAVASSAELAGSLARAAPDRNGWLRGAGYFESVAGALDRAKLDAMCPAHPLRVQHRSGSMWFLNSRAIEALGLDGGDAPAGVERDRQGRVTGRLFRLDGWLRARLPQTGPPDMAPVGRLLARYGVTGATDATPSNGPEEVALLRAAQRSGALPQRLRLMGGPELASVAGLSGSAEPADPADRADRDARSDLQPSAGLSIDAYKILLDEPALPELEALVDTIRSAHRSERAVAIHTVTRTEIHFALAALEAAGARPGDRLEHASVAPPDAIEQVSRLGVTIVTQPNFVRERGDDYLEAVAERDRPHLYRVRSWIDARVPLGGGSDAPFGDPDPWAAMRAASERTTRAGAVLGADERISPELAVALFQPQLGLLAADPAAPPGPPRPVRGARADLCLLDAPWQTVRADLSSERVVASLRDGETIHPASK